MAYYYTVTEAAATILHETAPHEDKRWGPDADRLLYALLELAHSADLNVSEHECHITADDSSPKRE